MTNQELAFSEIERLVKSFKDMPAAQRKGLNEMQTRLGCISHPNLNIDVTLCSYVF